jgi:hypothetical protein
MTCTAARMVPDMYGRHFWYACTLEAGHEGEHQTVLRWT